MAAPPVQSHFLWEQLFLLNLRALGSRLLTGFQGFVSTATLLSLPSAFPVLRSLYSLETLLSGSQTQHSGQDLGMGNPEEIAMRLAA